MQTIRKRKIIAIIGIGIAIIAMLSINTFAFVNGEYAAYYGNGLFTGISGQVTGTYDRFNYIYVEATESFTAVNGYGLIDNGTQAGTVSKNDVYYQLEYDGAANIGNHLREAVIYIPYKTDRNVYAEYEIIQGFETVTNVTIENVNIPQTTYRGYYIDNSGNSVYSEYQLWGNNTFPTTQGVKVTARFSSDGTVKIRVTLHFTSLSYADYMNNYGDMWEQANTVINTNHINTIGGYIRQILTTNLIYAFFVVEVILVALAVGYNWLTSL